MPEIAAYLFFDGNCAEVMRFYEKTLGGKLEVMMTNAQSPIADRIPPGNEDRMLHARLVFDGGMLMACDSMAGDKYEGIKGCSLSLVLPSADEARRMFDALAEGGKVMMPFDKPFWSEGFGMLVDRYGTAWMVNGPLEKM
jgi:PhnB protein